MATITGGNADDTLTGGTGNDSLDGGAGQDTLIGGRGNDIYVVDDPDDVITELAGGGTDTARSTAASYSLGAQVENLVLLAGAIAGTGNELRNSITGNAAANTLDGGAGVDTMSGGLGDDLYRVDVSGDVVTEGANGGVDTIESAATYSIAALAQVEHLTLTGSAHINATGNGGTNLLTGNDGNNVLDGGAGADTMVGGLGDDTYVLNLATDVVVELADQGSDTLRLNHPLTASIDLATQYGGQFENVVLLGAGAFHLSGNERANALTGNTAHNSLAGGEGNDTLDGGTGNDTMLGGEGNDTYFVNITTDVVAELENEGMDEVRSSITYMLGSNLENLTLIGAAAIHGTGNALANVITGNNAANSLDGGAGADTLIGGGGNDTYLVDDPDDVITELAGGGTDTARSTAASYVLGAQVENLVLLAGAMSGTGNELRNAITGNAAANTLDGGAGVDTMSGGAGDDVYLVDVLGDVVTEGANGGVDTIESAATYSIAALAQVEHLTLTGSAHINATGNGAANVLTGNDGNNVLDGGAGADTMIGGLGDDTYVLNLATDVVVELADQGSDTLRLNHPLTASIDLATQYGGHFENVVLLGAGAFHLSGNERANALTGNASNNSLAGGQGNDTLDGGTGNDTMLGGEGNDVYYVNATGDLVLEEGATQAFAVDLVSTLADGSNTSRPTSGPAISADGRYVTFVADSIDFVTAHTRPGAFLKDVETGELTRTNIWHPSRSGNAGPLTDARVAADGTTFFTAVDFNLTLETGGWAVYAYEPGEAGPVLVTPATPDSRLEDISADGRYVVIQQMTGVVTPIVMLDRVTSVISPVSENAARPAVPFYFNNAHGANVAPDGSFVSFSTSSDYFTGLSTATRDVYLRDMSVADPVQAVRLVSTSSAGVAGNRDSLGVDVSAGGRYVLFESLATNLVAGDTNGVTDVFVKDRLTGATTRVSTSGTGAQANGESTGMSISADGRFVLFRSQASNLVGDDTNGFGDYFVKDLRTGQVALVSRTEAGDVVAHDILDSAQLSDDGRFIALVSRASLTAGDSDAFADAYRIANPLYRAATAGIDEVRSSITYALGEQLENLTLIGAAAIHGTGNALANVITGNGAANSLDGGTGADTLIGGGGNDTYLVDDPDDVITELAAGGTDTARSTAASYVLGAQVENLVLLAGAIAGTGNELRNSITGNAAANTLDGGAGVDTLIGGAGDDLYRVDVSGDVVSEGANGGVDTIESAATYSIAALAQVEHLSLTGSAHINATGNGGANILTGNDGNNVLDGGAGADTMVGGLGDDTYVLNLATDVVVELADQGSDTLRLNHPLTASIDLATQYGGHFENVVLLGAGAFHLSGNERANALTGNASNNSLAGGEGNDTLDGGTGNDTMLGGDGNDVYYVDVITDVVTELENGGVDYVNLRFTSGTWTIDLQSAAWQHIESLDAVLSNGRAGFTMLGNDAGNLLRLGGRAGVALGRDGNDYLEGSPGADRLEGGDGDDTIAGSSGRDTMIGGAGDDLYHINDATDVVVEEAGGGTDTAQLAYVVAGTATVDLATAWSGHLEHVGMAAAMGRLNLLGNGAANALTGSDAANLLSGRGGDDTLDGGAGNDTLIGGAGDDLFYLRDAGDVVVEAAGEGDDTLRIEFQPLATALSLVALSGGNFEHVVLWPGVEARFDVLGNDAANRIQGGNGDTSLAGGAGNDTLDGGWGSDTLVGGSGDDVLYGYAGDDSLVGGEGNDVLDDVQGNNVLRGDTGDDTYYVYADVVGGVSTVIENFNGGIDTVVSAEFWHRLADNVENLELAGTSDRWGTGNNGANRLTGNAGSNLLEGLGGNDTLIGGAGADDMDGGSGNDLYVVDHVDDRTFDSLGGIDTVQASVQFQLFTGTENLELTGTADIAGLGNAGANVITGNAGDNVLYGAAGIDVLQGGAGDDRYVLAGSTTAEAPFFLLSIDSAEGEAISGGSRFYSSAQGSLTVTAVDSPTDDDTFVETLHVSYTAFASGETWSLDVQGFEFDGFPVSLTAGSYGGLHRFGTEGSGWPLALAVDGRAPEAVTGRVFLHSASFDYSGATPRVTALAIGFTQFSDGSPLGLSAKLVIGTGAVDATPDQVLEQAGAGNDTVEAGVSYTLTANVENLVLTGHGDISGTGNALDNRISGNFGANLLTGGGGADRFVFATAPDAAHVDTLADFTSGSDAIELDGAFFAALAPGALDAQAFADHFAYDAGSGALYYDADGAGAGAAVHFATLSGAPALQAADFFVA